jgi:hypothetical protein
MSDQKTDEIQSAPTIHNIIRYGADGRELERDVTIDIYLSGDYVHLHTGGRQPKRYLIPLALWRQATQISEVTT